MLTAEQVFTNQAKQPRGLKSKNPYLSDRYGSILQSASRSPYYRVARERRSRNRARQGGWGATIELSYAEVQYQRDCYFAARRNRTPLNWFVSVRGANGIRNWQDLPEAKRKLQIWFARFGQALHRRGIPHIAVGSFEREREQDFIHAHELVHIPAEAAADLIERFHDGDTVQFIAAARRHLSYIGKQREQLSPDFERQMRGTLWRRQPGDYIPGPRLIATKEIRALVAEAKPRRKTTPLPAIQLQPDSSLNHCNINDLGAVNGCFGQLALPLTASPIDLLAQAEAKRKAEGIPQHLVARRLGIRQPQYSNAVVRRHDTLSPWALNRVREYVAGELAA